MKTKILTGATTLLVALSLMIYPYFTTRTEGVFTTVSTKQVKVNVSTVNYRSGAGTGWQILDRFTSGQILDVVGKIGDWYVVKTAADQIGCVYAPYTIPYTPDTTIPPATNPAPVASSDQSAMQTEMLGLVNKARADAGLGPLTLDSKLSAGAYAKSRDMAVNQYFSHTSPTYGSPFEMMHQFGITYTAAGENIARHTSVQGAHDAFMNSPGHRANILSTSYGKVGFGFYTSGPYLYVTQWFTD
ncbi:MAG: CAP domain-containing protein [Solirubrobacterales bacterium]